MGTHTETQRYRIVLSIDRVRAFAETPGAGAPGFTPPSEEDVLGTLAEAGIELDDAVRERVAQYVELTRSALNHDSNDGPPEIPERFLLAEGTPPIEAADGEFIWDSAYEREIGDWQADAPVDYYTQNSILTVDVGQIIGVIKPPTDGVPGRSLLGDEVEPRRKKGSPLKVGSGLKLVDDESGRVETTAAGRLERDGLTLRMCELLTIPRDVDFKSGNIDCVTDVHIGGMVKPNFSVRTTRSLTVKKDTESAELIVGKDLIVRGGIFGQESGRLIKAGGCVTAAICDAALLEAGGDVKIAKVIINSNVRAGGRLEIERGAIIGGEVYARNGVSVKDIGSEAGVPTRVAVGFDGAKLLLAKKMEKDATKLGEQSEQIRTQVQPLLSNIKRLTPTQREQATELVYKANEISNAAEQLTTKRTDMLLKARPTTPAGVDVSGVLHADVTLAFGLRETVTKTSLKGPLRIEERQVEGVTEIVLVNVKSGAATVLPSSAVDPARFKQQIDPESGEEDGTDQT